MSYKRLFSRALNAAPGRLHVAAHSHHLWPDASFEGQVEAWNDAAALADKKWDKVFAEVMPQTRGFIARELNLPDPNTIAFAPNTHELLLRVISAKEMRPVEILTSDGEFHSFRRQSARLAENGDVVLRIVPAAPYDSFADRFLAAMAAQAPDIAFVSQVMFKAGLVFERFEELAAFADPDGPWIVIDGYHGFMAQPTDLSRVADRVFYLAGGYKYAMAGEGVCFLHAPPGFGPRPVNTGWYAEFGDLEGPPGGVGYAKDGARFLGATFDPSGLYRFNAVQNMLAAEGLNTEMISVRLAGLRADLADRIAAGEAGVLREAEPLPLPASRWPARFLALRDPRAGAWKSALSSHNVITDTRDDVLRIGLGLYHDAEDIELFCQAARRL